MPTFSISTGEKTNTLLSLLQDGHSTVIHQHIDKHDTYTTHSTIMEFKLLLLLGLKGGLLVSYSVHYIQHQRDEVCYSFFFFFFFFTCLSTHFFIIIFIIIIIIIVFYFFFVDVYVMPITLIIIIFSRRCGCCARAPVTDHATHCPIFSAATLISRRCSNH